MRGRKRKYTCVQVSEPKRERGERVSVYLCPGCEERDREGAGFGC